MRRAALVAGVAWLVIAAGCAAGRPTIDPVADAPAWADLARVQNERVERLDRIYSRGVVELQWTDAGGARHVEPQVDLHLFVDLPRRTAVRCEKLGRVLLWVGSDETSVWLFDLTGDERVLYLGTHETALRDATGLPVPFEPAGLLDLMGLTPIPGSDGAVAYDAARDAWVIETVGRGGPVRISFDRATRLPKRVELLDDAGAIVADSSLARYRTVTIAGVAPGLMPKLATLVDARELEGGGLVKLALDEPTDEVIDRVFDLERVTEALRPQRVVGGAGSAGDV